MFRISPSPYTVASAYACVDLVSPSITSGSTPANCSVLANFWVESAASPAAPMKPNTYVVSLLNMSAAMFPTADPSAATPNPSTKRLPTPRPALSPTPSNPPSDLAILSVMPSAEGTKWTHAVASSTPVAIGHPQPSHHALNSDTRIGSEPVRAAFFAPGRGIGFGFGLDFFPARCQFPTAI